MNRKPISPNVTVLTLAIVALAVIVLAQALPGMASRVSLFDSPLPTLPPYPPPSMVTSTPQPYPPPQTPTSMSPPATPIPHWPTPTPVLGPSEAAQKALTYIAQRKGISLQDLVVVTDHPTMYPNLGRRFQVVTILDTSPEGQFYNLLVDLDDGHITEDVATVREAEERAYLDRYGKMELALYKRLQEIEDNDVLPVAIWVAGEPQRSQEELFAAVAARFPEAQAALSRSGKPWDVEDPELAARIKAEYNRLSVANTAMRIEPLVSYLRQRGAEIRTYGALPSVTTWLTKRQILELTQRDDVGMIYLIRHYHGLSRDRVIVPGSEV